MTHVRNQCKACSEQLAPVDAPLVSKHYCSRESLASLYGGSPRTYTNVIGHVEGWADSWRPCSVCGTRENIVAHKPVKTADRVWCVQHVGQNRGQTRSNPFAVFVAACYSRVK